MIELLFDQLPLSSLICVSARFRPMLGMVSSGDENGFIGQISAGT